MYLSRCLKTINDEFSKDWIIESSVKGKNNKQEIFLQLITKVTLLGNELFKNLNYSVLTGEYIQSDTFLQDIEELIRALDQVTVDKVVINHKKVNNDFKNEVDSFILQIFVLPVKTALKHYRRFQQKSGRKYSSPNNLSLIDAFKNDEKLYGVNNYPNNVIKQKSQEFISLNLKLAEYDHNIAIRPNILQSLVLIYSSLKDKKSETDKIYNILFEKCCFLIHKFLSRYNQDKKNFLYAIDFEDKELIKENFTSEIFHDFIQRGEIHYRFSAEDYYIRKFSGLVDKALHKRQKGNPLNFQECHCLVKYYKDDNVNKKLLKDLYDSFCRENGQMEFSSSPFDKRAYNISKNYIYNNILSFEISNKKPDLDEIERILEEIKFLQNQTEVKNYFPYYKACKFLLDELSMQFDYSTERTLDQRTVGRIIGLLEQYEENLYKNLEWCTDRNFFAFQSPFGECLKDIEVENEKINLFIASSFVLPINYEALKKEIEEISRKINKNRTIFEIHKSTASEKAKLDEVQRKIENSEKKHIEILSIFSAIVLFVSGNIQIFSKVETIQSAFRFMLLFAYVLAVFVILIWLITRENTFSHKNIPKLHWFVIGLVVVSTIGAFALVSEDLFGSSKKDVPKEKSIGEKTTNSTLKLPLSKKVLESVNKEDSIWSTQVK